MDIFSSIFSNAKRQEKFRDIIQKNILVLAYFYNSADILNSVKPLLCSIKKIYGDKIRVVCIDVRRESNLCLEFEINAPSTLMIYKYNYCFWRQNGVITNIDNLKRIIDDAEAYYKYRTMFNDDTLERMGFYPDLNPRPIEYIDVKESYPHSKYGKRYKKSAHKRRKP